METEIRAILPNIDPVVSEYSVGYLNHASVAFTDEEDSAAISPLSDAAAAVTELLLSASGDSDANLGAGGAIAAAAALPLRVVLRAA